MSIRHKNAVGVWLCGCVTVLLRGCVAMWLCGCISVPVSVPVCVCLRVCVCVREREREYLHVCICVCVYRYIYIYIHIYVWNNHHCTVFGVHQIIRRKFHTQNNQFQLGVGFEFLGKKSKTDFWAKMKCAKARAASTGFLESIFNTHTHTYAYAIAHTHIHIMHAYTFLPE